MAGLQFFDTTLQFISITLHNASFNYHQKLYLKFIQKFAGDLKDYGKEYSYKQLKKMSQFAHFFSENEIRSQPVTKIPWSTLSRIIIQKSFSKEEALWHIDQAYKNRWSRAIVSDIK